MRFSVNVPRVNPIAAVVHVLDEGFSVDGEVPDPQAAMAELAA